MLAGCMCEHMHVHGGGAHVWWGDLPGGVLSFPSPSLCLSFPDQPPAFPFSHSLLHQFILDMVSMVF